jgi:hypothetical protein
MDQISPDESEWALHPARADAEGLSPLPGTRRCNVAQAALVYGVHRPTIQRWTAHPTLMDRGSPEDVAWASYAGLAAAADHARGLLQLEAPIGPSGTADRVHPT